MENIFTAARHFRNWFLQLSTSNGDCFSKPVGHQDCCHEDFLFLLHFNLIYFKRGGALEERWANIMFYNSWEWWHGVCGEGEGPDIYIVHQMLQMDRGGLCLLINFIGFFISIKSPLPSYSVRKLTAGLADWLLTVVRNTDWVTPLISKEKM